MTTWTINGRSPDDSFVFRSGLKMQVTPEGDCREATFMAKGAGLGLRPLDLVEISCDGQRLFAGELRVGGNLRDVNGHQYTVRSLALRLKEVVIPADWSAPQQNASATVRSLIESVMPQLGGAFSVGNIALPFDCRAITNANQQNPYALLEQIAQDGAAMGIDVRFGVNANRQFFCQPKSEGGMGMPDGQTGGTRWDAPVAETPCTAVLWYVAKKPDGSWVTHMSQAPEAAQYGVRVKPVSLTSDEGLWELVTDGQWSATARTQMDGAPTVTPLTAEQVAQLTTRGNTAAVASTAPGWLGVRYAPNTPVDRYSVRAVATSAGTGVVGVTSGWIVDEAAWQARQAGWFFTDAGAGSIPQTKLVPEATYQTKPALVGNTSVGVKADGAYDSITLNVYELRPERLKTELLDRLARYHYSIPHEAAGEIEVKGLYPLGAGQLDGVPIAAYEYRISADRGVCTAILLGQADDPNKLAQAELIKARDNQATINALISKE